MGDCSVEAFSWSQWDLDGLWPEQVHELASIVPLHKALRSASQPISLEADVRAAFLAQADATLGLPELLCGLVRDPSKGRAFRSTSAVDDWCALGLPEERRRKRRKTTPGAANADDEAAAASSVTGGEDRKAASSSAALALIPSGSSTSLWHQRDLIDIILGYDDRTSQRARGFALQMKADDARDRGWWKEHGVIRK